MELNKTNPNKKRALSLSVLELCGLSFGCAIGWGSFVMPGDTFLPNAGPLGSIIAITIGAVIFYLIGRCFAYMMGKTLDAGGPFIYVHRLMGRGHAFLTAWSLGFAYISILWSNANSIPRFVEALVGDMFHFGFQYAFGGQHICFGEILLGIGTLVFYALFTIYGKFLVMHAMTVMALLILICNTIMFIGVVSASDLAAAFTPAFAPTGLAGIQIYQLLLLTPWMFLGFETIAFTTTNTKDPEKKALTVFPITLSLAALTYIFMTVIAATALPPGFENNASYIAHVNEINGLAHFPTLYAVTEKMGALGVTLFTVSYFCAISTTLIGFFYILGCLTRSASIYGMLPKKYAKINSDGVAEKGIRLVMFISLLIPFAGHSVSSWFSDATAVSATIALAYTCLCCIYYAKKYNDNKYQTFGYIGIVFSIALFLLPLITSMLFGNIFDTEAYFILAFWGVIGYALTAIVCGHS